MKTKIKLVSSIIALSLTTASANTNAQDTTANIQSSVTSGKPTFISGNLGASTPEQTITRVKSILATQPEYGFTGSEDFTVKRQWVDKLGQVHTHLNQSINGIKVYGTSMIVHATGSGNINSLTSNMSDNTTINAISGTLAVIDANQVSPQNDLIQSFLIKRKQTHKIQPHVLGENLPNSRSTITAPTSSSEARALVEAKNQGEVVDAPELAYVYLPLTGETKLVWKIEVKYNSNDSFEHDRVFFDAETSVEVARHPLVHRAKTYNTYTHNNRPYNDSSQRQLLCSTGQTCSDVSAQRAHDGASKVYDYYKNTHSRNGINDSDLVMNSNVHVGSNWNNAVWYQNQMFYGDGDGSQFTDFTLSFDIIGHELTHGVTQYSANLIYQNASGALNEAMSDILGVAAEAYSRGVSQPTWKLGGASYTPNIDGDGLRYMNNPTQDGYSKDYYPERIPFSSTPNNNNDQGGVHGNSGIANLAFVLLVDGGQHPRNKTNATVPKIGLAKAEKIFYRALTTYFTQSTSFEEARTGTAQAAQDLYGAAEKTAVETAWCAVGVGTCPDGGTPPSGNSLENGVAKTNLSASKGSDIVYTLDVPAGATNINFAMTGGSGDADLYVKFGSTPTDSSYDCRPYKTGNTESCTDQQTGGKYYVRVKAYSAFSGVSLTASYTEGSGSNIQPIDDTVSNLTVSKRQWKRYTLELVDGYKDMIITMSGGTGDADLYVRQGVQSTTSNYDCRPYESGNNEVCNFSEPKAGTWHIDVYGYQAATGVTLNIKATPK